MYIFKSLKKNYNIIYINSNEVLIYFKNVINLFLTINEQVFIFYNYYIELFLIVIYNKGKNVIIFKFNLKLIKKLYYIYTVNFNIILNS